MVKQSGQVNSGDCWLAVTGLYLLYTTWENIKFQGIV